MSKAESQCLRIRVKCKLHKVVKLLKAVVCCGSCKEIKRSKLEAKCQKLKVKCKLHGELKFCCLEGEKLEVEMFKVVVFCTED